MEILNIIDEENRNEIKRLNEVILELKRKYENNEDNEESEDEIIIIKKKK
jgi:hypothetical protein